MNKKIVSLEEHLPEAKKERRKKANRHLIMYLSFFFLLICLIIYLQSPLSDIRVITITGNQFLSEKDIIETSGLSKNKNFWTIKENKISEKIVAHEVVRNVEVSKKFPYFLTIEVEEFPKVAYLKDQEGYFPVLGNGAILSPIKKLKGDAPILLGFQENEHFQQMIQELNDLSKSVLNLISEIHWEPIEEDPNKITLYMNDQFIVKGTIRNFAEKMKYYPSIVSQITSENKGIIHMGVGVYFEEFDSMIED